MTGGGGRAKGPGDGQESFGKKEKDMWYEYAPEPWDFSKEPNLHPVFRTYTRTARRLEMELTQPRNHYIQARPNEDPMEHMQRADRYRYHQIYSSAPAPNQTLQSEKDPYSNANRPLSWSEQIEDALPHDYDNLQAFSELWITFSSDQLERSSKGELPANSQRDSVIYVANEFVMRSLGCREEGTHRKKCDDKGNPGFYQLEPEPGGGVSARVVMLPKIDVYCETLVYKHRDMLRLFRVLYGITEEDHDDAWIERHVDFQAMLNSPKNIAGYRVRFVALDKHFNFGTAFQHRLWRDQIFSGRASAYDIYTIHKKITEERKAWAQAHASAAAAGGERAGNVPAPHPDEMPQIDPLPGDPPRGPSAAELAAAVQEREEERVRGDEAEEAEPAGENLAAAGGAGAGRGGRGGGRGRGRGAGGARAIPRNEGPVVPELSAKEQEKQDRDRVLTQIRFLGIKLPGLSTQNENLSSHHHTAPWVMWNATSQLDDNKRVTMKTFWSSAGSKLKVSLALLPKHYWFKEEIYNNDTLLNGVYKPLLGETIVNNMLARMTAEERNLVRDNTSDLGLRKHPLHPTKWFTFENTLNATFYDKKQREDILKDYVKAYKDDLDNPANPYPIICPEQTEEYYYYDAVTGELDFPIKSLVYKLPAGSFRAASWRRNMNFSYFSNLDQKLAVTRQEIARRQQAQLRANPVPMETTNGDDDNLEMPDSVLGLFKQKKFNLGREKMGSGRNGPGTGQSSVHAVPEVVDNRMLRKWRKKYITDIDAARQQNADHIIVDIWTEDRTDAQTLLNEIDRVSLIVPENRPLLMRYFRRERLELLKRRMTPGARTRNDVTGSHAAAVYSLNGETRKRIGFSITGYENLSFRNSVLADLALHAKTSLGLIHSHHVFVAMLIGLGINAYRETRLIALHFLKVGASGIGKSVLDDMLIKCRNAASMVRVDHASTMSTFIGQVQNDICYIHDETPPGMTGDMAHSKTSAEQRELSLMKAGLSQDYVNFMRFQKMDGCEPAQIRLRVATRSCRTANVNFLPVNDDGAIYDRFIIYMMAPVFVPAMANIKLTERVKDAALQTLVPWWADGMRMRDSIHYRVCKGITVGAFADPDVDPLCDSLLAMLRKLKRYGFANNASMRCISRAMEYAKCMTIFMAVEEILTGPGSVTWDWGNGRSHTIKPWNDEFLTAIRKRLMLTSEMIPYLVSVTCRQFMGDSSNYDILEYIARKLGGYTHEYFEHLFKRGPVEDTVTGSLEGWGPAWTSKLDAATGTYKYKQRFAFCDDSRLLKNPSRGTKLSSYVVERELQCSRYSVLGMQQRKWGVMTAAGRNHNGAALASSLMQPSEGAANTLPELAASEMPDPVAMASMQEVPIEGLAATLYYAPGYFNFSNTDNKAKNFYSKKTTQEYGRKKKTDNAIPEAPVHQAVQQTERAAAAREQINTLLDDDSSSVITAPGAPQQPYSAATAAAVAAADGGTTRLQPPPPMFGDPSVNLRKICVDPNYIILPMSLRVLGQLYSAQMGNSMMIDPVNITQQLLHFSRMTVNVPILNVMSHSAESPSFSQSFSARENCLTVDTHPVNFIRETVLSEDLRSPEHGNPIIARKGMTVVKISTMAMYCVRYAHVLEECLQALEDEDTIKQDCLIDMPILGKDGVYHVYTTHPFPGRKLKRKENLHKVSETVMRSLYMDISSASLETLTKRASPEEAQYPSRVRAMYQVSGSNDGFGTSEVDATLASATVEAAAAIDRWTAPLRSRATPAPASLGVVSNPTSAIAGSHTENILGEYDVSLVKRREQEDRLEAQRVARGEAKRTPDQLRWVRMMERQYGIVETEAKPYSSHKQYPGKLDKLMQDAYKVLPEYKRTRDVYGDRRPIYPDPIVQEWEAEELELLKPNDPSQFLKIPSIRCARSLQKYSEELLKRRNEHTQMLKEKLQEVRTFMAAQAEADKQHAQRLANEGTFPKNPPTIGAGTLPAPLAGSASRPPPPLPRQPIAVPQFTNNAMPVSQRPPPPPPPSHRPEGMDTSNLSYQDAYDEDVDAQVDTDTLARFSGVARSKRPAIPVNTPNKRANVNNDISEAAPEAEEEQEEEPAEE